jgi:hypothetical protein
VNPVKEKDMRMSSRFRAALPVAVFAIALASCQAEQQTIDQGATFDAPPEVEQAPAMPGPPQPFTPGMTEGGPGTAQDTLADTAAVPRPPS